MSACAKILIIDDEEKIRELLDEVLSNKGYETFTAKDGDQGLRLFEKNAPDLVITDVMLPRIDGFELVKRIRQYKDGKTLPIIMMSAVYRDLQVRDQTIEKYGVDYLLKPFGLVDLLRRINRMLGLEASDNESGEATSSSEEAAKMNALQGKIEHFSVPIVLLSIYSQEKTGLLDLVLGKKINKIYFLKGVPVFAETRERKKDPEFVEKLLRGILSWQTGEYQFQELDSIPPSIPTFEYNFFQCIYDGARRYYKMEILIEKFQKYQNCIVLPKDDFNPLMNQLYFDEKEKQMVQSVDGKKTVGELIGHHAQDMAEFFQLLWIMEFMGAIEFQK